MTPQEQVNAIILMMNPEASGTTDAVFLVQDYMNKRRAEKAALEARVAKLEADLEAKSQEVHAVRNEKLESETRLKKEKADIIAEIPVVATEGGVALDQKPADVTKKQKGKTQ